MRSMTLYNFLLEATLMGSVLIVLVLLLRLTLRKALGNRAIYAAWLMVAVRLLLPLSFPNPLMNEFRPSLSVDLGARPIADQVRTRFIDLCYDVAFALEPVFGWNVTQPLRTIGAETSYGHTGKWILLAYAIVAVGLLLLILLQKTRFRRRVRRDRVGKLEGDALECYHALCAELGMKPLSVYFVEPLRTPCLVGLFKPFIAIPSDLPREHLQSLLRHELCHHKARDEWWTALGSLCCAVHWFDPLVWLAVHLSRLDAERSCDDRAIAKLSVAERVAYSDMLASAADRARMGLCLSSKGLSVSAKQLKSRMDGILHHGTSRKGLCVLAAIFGACLLVASFGTAESRPLPTVQMIPEVAAPAVPVTLQTEEEAIEYARHFLESPFIGHITSGMTFTAVADEGRWRVYATERGHALPLLLWFDQDGFIRYYDNSRVIPPADDVPDTYAHQTPIERVYLYAQAFFEALLPDKDGWVFYVDQDTQVDEMRYIIGHSKDELGNYDYQIVLQVEPFARVVEYYGGMRYLKNGKFMEVYEQTGWFENVLCEWDAQRAVLSALTEVANLSAKIIDAGAFTMEQADEGWLVSFTGAGRSFRWLVDEKSAVTWLP